MIVCTTELPAPSLARTRSATKPLVSLSAGWLIVTVNRLPPSRVAGAAGDQVLPSSKDADTVAVTPAGDGSACWCRAVKVNVNGFPAGACEAALSGRS